jgi:hypothetical protein
MLWRGVNGVVRTLRIPLLLVSLVVSSAVGAQYSGNYGCTQDCSGHAAGYAWAEQRDITDPGECGGKSQSFIEGCMDYAEARERELREDAGCDGDDDSCDVD